MKLTFPHFVPIAGLLFAVLALPSAHARLAPTNGIGGNGGSAFRVDCGESGVLVGLVGRAGVVIDRIGGLCVKVDPHFGTMIGGVYETTSHGGPGGVTFRRQCPASQVVVGITGDTKDMFGWTVVRSLNVVCRALSIRGEIMTVQSTARPLYWDPSIVKEDLLVCPTYLREPNWEWTRMGLALEGSTGDYVDRLRLVCGTLTHDPSALRMEVQSSPVNQTVSERAPMTLRWRVISTRPHLTPSLQTTWELMDYNHMVKTLLFDQPSGFVNPCAYVKGPCKQNETSVTFQGLPPGNYELKLTAAPTGARARADGALQPTAQVKFEVRSRFAEASIAEKVPLNRLGTLPAKPDNATATATQRTASKGSSALAAAPAGAASVPALKLPQQHASPFTLKPTTGLTTSLKKPVSRAQGDIGSTPAGPRPAAIDKLAPKSAF